MLQSSLGVLMVLNLPRVQSSGEEDATP
ncbi:hypothetical protein PR003_g29482, partial [Phytophthora rubi]